mmetsp:Transcript_20539/g.30431  ORF Transcript_20539/g.30431 Transcript_20539/m.30431 type:complete len:949 (-) Transcript_20539:2897-5743(-)
MLAGKDEDAALVCKIEGHGHGAVKALAFSKLDTHMMATGGSDGQVLVTDLSNPSAPVTTMPAGEPSPGAEVTSLAWNTQVAHIVAAADNSGLVTVWDLKSKKPWCELRADGVAVSDLAWNPTQGLHLLTASVDDRNPLLKLWDLRASTSHPLATMAGHSQGILSFSWCPHDDTLLLSCAKDNRTILWDLYTLQPIADLPHDEPQQNGHSDPSQLQDSSQLFGAGGLSSSQQKRYDVRWSPLKRGVISTCSFDRKVQAHSVNGLATKCGRPPKWLKPSSGVSCGFGGQVISFGSVDKNVTMETVVEQATLVAASQEFEAAFAATTVMEFCQDMMGKLTRVEVDEKQIWSFMQVIFETNARAQLLGHLGFQPEQIAEAASKYEEISAPGGTSPVMSKTAEETIKKALVVGNFEAAVECCIRSNNMADALILASCGGSELWAKTQERYFASEAPKRPFLSIVGAVITNQMADLVEKSDTAAWQETLAILSTYGKSEEFPSLCVALGDRLEEAGDSRSACICYMCASSLDRAVLYWQAKLESANVGGSTDLIALHKFVVKVSVFLKGLGTQVALAPDIESKFSEYAKVLAEQGELITAAKYCRGSDEESRILRDRLYRSKDSQYCLAAMGAAPDFPYSMVQVNRGPARSARPKPQVQQQQQQQAYAQQPSTQAQAAPAPAARSQPSSDQLPPGWMALQDPTSGMTYYANQTTGETTWEKPVAAPAPAPMPAPAPAPMAQNNHAAYGTQAQHQPAQQQQTQPAQVQQPVANGAGGPASTPSRQQKLVSKYGDSFVTSSSHPELGAQYGNVGTSNPYGAQRQGIAAVSDKKPPVSGTYNPNTIPNLEESEQPIKEGLLEIVSILEGAQLSAGDKKQLSEGQKGIAVLVKRLARGDLDDEITGKVLTLVNALRARDFASAAAIQTGLVNSDWRNHKDWLKGIKNLIQLATKKLYT